MLDYKKQRHLERQYRIGDFLVDPSGNSLNDGESQTIITPKMMAVLCFLAQNKGITLSRENIFDAVWGEVSTSDEVLSRAIADLRKALGDSAKTPKYIETVSKKGYRFIAPVEKKINRKDLQSVRNKIWRFGALLLAILTITLVFIFVRFSLPTPNPFQAEIRPLTFDNYKQRTPRFNFDGSSIVYTYEKDEQADVYLKSITNNQEFKLTNTNALEDHPVFSSNGKQILFRRYDQQTCHFVILDVASQKERSMANCPESKTQSFDWSLDQKFIVTTQYDENLNSEGLIRLDLITGEIISIVKPQLRNTGYLFPRISPSGRYLSFVRFSASTNHWAIVIYDMEKSVFNYELSLPQQANQVAWGKSDEMLYYAADDTYRPGIWQINLTNKQQTYLFHGDILDMDYDRKTSQFAVVRRQYDSNISQIANDGTGLKQIVNPPSQEYDIAISPDGKILAYVSNRSGQMSLWIRIIDTGVEKLLYQPDSGYANQPNWAYDGQSLFVQQLTPTTSRLVQVFLDGSYSDYFPNSRNTFAVMRSTNSDGLIWSELVDEQWQTFYRASKSNKPQKIIDTAVSKIAMYKSDLYYSLPGNIDLYHLQQKDGNPVTSKIPKIFLVSPKAWEMTDNGIYFIGWIRSSQPAQLRFYDFSTRQITNITTVDKSISLAMTSLTVPEQGTPIYFSSVDRFSHDLELISWH